MPQTVPQVWDLESLFAGGSQSQAFSTFLNDLEADIASWKTALTQAPSPVPVPLVSDWVLRTQEISARMREAGAFVSCLNAQDDSDQKAKGWNGRVRQVRAALVQATLLLDDILLGLPDADWEALSSDPALIALRFPLEERRTRAQDRLDPERETLISDLMVDGYHAWSDLYDTIVGRIRIPFEDPRLTEGSASIPWLSASQAANKLTDADRSVRTAVSGRWEEAWGDVAELCADSLNHLAGYRLAVYRHRGWDSVLQEPLEINRMSSQTLDAMWGTIEQNKAPFVTYLQRKAKLIGVGQLSWHDVSAPLGAVTKTFSFDEARELIVRQFHQFSPQMAEFADSCFERRWIEAEDRPGKRPGAFCTSFPVREQTRVFMTFSGTYSNVTTLAHELGHAYHQHVMRGLPQMVQNYAMNVAETASTFAEAIVADAALRAATDKQEQIALLEDKVQQSVAMFMNIHSRFLFETRFYEQRKRGLVNAQALNEIMVQAQQEAFCGALGTWHPHFWASKLHFYITATPFYNFPYTFGYMFSNGIYARALAEGPAFSDKYVALLRDTGRMRVEDLAAYHLGVDLTKPDFWQHAVDVARADVDEFLRITE